MRRGVCIAVAVAALSAGPRLGLAQEASVAPVAPGERAGAVAPEDRDAMLVYGARASTWAEGAATVVQIEGPVRIEVNRARLTADGAVVWFTPVPADQGGGTRAQVALLGTAAVETDNARRTQDELFVTATVVGPVRLNVDDLAQQDLSTGDAFARASALQTRSLGAQAPTAVTGVTPGAVGGPERPPRRQPAETPAEATATPEMPPAPEGAPPSGASPADAVASANVPTTAPAASTTGPVSFRAGNIQTTPADDGTVAVVLTGDVVVIQKRPTGELLELTSRRAVLFTTVGRLGDLAAGGADNDLSDAVTSAYLEGDVRVNVTSAPGGAPERRLEADRAFHEFATDRAVLTDAILRTTEPRAGVPVVVRAKAIRQLASGEYAADGAVLSTSQFATPDYALNADRVYVRQVGASDDRAGRTTFGARNVTLRTFGVPFFYLPAVGGTVDQGAFPLRGLAVENSRTFGTGVRTRWGLFETIGLRPPAGLDASYNVDYFSERGVGVGLDAAYGGDRIENGDATGFAGGFTSYLINDRGDDRLGRRRRTITRDDPELRGRVAYEHQQFFSGDVQLQLRAGYVTDETFLAEYYENEFNNGLPTEFSAYLKRARDSEAVTLSANYQPNDFITAAEQIQELAAVERLPELRYLRLGDSLADDRLTFFSDDRLGLLRFHPNDRAIDVGGYGFRNVGDFDRDESFRGIPSYGYTGPLDATGRERDYDDSATARGDFRQEVDFPIALADGRAKVVPFAVGRYTAYSDSPRGGAKNRFLAGVGARASTAFYRVDDSARSTLFDVNRVRHVVEPQASVFASVQTENRNDLFIYDEQVDGIQSVQAARLALNQTWQTKRGGPGRQRSVDFLTFDVGMNLFGDQPDEAAGFRNSPDGLKPETADAYRSVYFESEPEASIARSGVDATLVWRVSDTTAVISDADYNLDHATLATTALGVAARRGDRLSYYVGGRYIGEINTSLARVALSYELTQKYSVALNQSFDLEEGTSRSTSATLVRRFDRFLTTVSVYFDRIGEEGGVRFGIVPYGVGAGLNSNAIGQFFGSR